MLKTSSVVLAILITVSAGAEVQNLPGASESYGGFGLQNKSGSRLLVKPALAKSELLKTALCSRGGRLPVQFAGRQAAREGGNLRDSPSNFDHLAGSIFAVPTGTVNPDATCFLASDSLLAGSTVLSIAAPVGSGPCAQPNRFAALRTRPVVHCWPIARMSPESPEKQVVLLEFERRGKDALASLAFVDGARTIFADFPAEYTGPGESLWRIDDDGKLSPDGITIVCALQRGNWSAMGVAWSGAEGKLLMLWIADGGDRFTKVLNDYWYQAPI